MGATWDYADQNHPIGYLDRITAGEDLADTLARAHLLWFVLYQRYTPNELCAVPCPCCLRDSYEPTESLSPAPFGS